MEKILQLIKRTITKYYPKDGILNGGEFERGRQSLAKELADVIDPINNENSKPDVTVEMGEPIYQKEVRAVPQVGWGRVLVSAFVNGECKLTTNDLEYTEEMNDMVFELTVRPVRKEKKQLKDELPDAGGNALQKPKAKRRGVANQNGDGLNEDNIRRVEDVLNQAHANYQYIEANAPIFYGQM